LFLPTPPNSGEPVQSSASTWYSPASFMALSSPRKSPGNPIDFERSVLSQTCCCFEMFVSLDELLARFWSEIAARPQGPMALRFFVQPAMSTFFAFRDGIKDARNRRPAYFWALFVCSGHRRELLRHGWKSAGRVFTMAVVIDLVYQTVVLRGFRPVQAVVVAALLALLPYLALRGPVNRVARLLKRRDPESQRVA
jgi:hypothetical protein